jgi:hypothetical protein
MTLELDASPSSGLTIWPTGRQDTRPEEVAMRPPWESLPTIIVRLASLTADVATITYVVVHSIG